MSSTYSHWISRLHQRFQGLKHPKKWVSSQMWWPRQGVYLCQLSSHTMLRSFVCPASLILEQVQGIEHASKKEETRPCCKYHSRDNFCKGPLWHSSFQESCLLYHALLIQVAVLFAPASQEKAPFWLAVLKFVGSKWKKTPARAPNP